MQGKARRMKTIFITGVNKGLGYQLYTLACNKGYNVYGLVRSKDNYERMVQSRPANAKLIHADVSEDNCIEKVRAVIENIPVDLLINNAGIGGEGMVLNDTTTTEIMALFNIHCLGALRMCQALRSNLHASSRPVVLNMNSRFGSIGYQFNRFFKGFEISYSYRIAKAAQNMLTNCLRNEFGDKIEFVSITPGRLITDIAQKDANLTPEEGARRIIEHWEAEKFRSENGILQVPDLLTPW